MLTAITRPLSRSIARCELTFLDRHPIDLAAAEAQHDAYTAALAALGCRVIALDPIHELPDEAFVDEMNRRYEAVPAEARGNAELMELLLPGLRADVSVCDTYAYAEGDPLDCSISAYGGEQDRSVSREELEGWRRQTRGDFALTLFPGDHFFLRTAEQPLLAAVSDVLRRVAP